MLSLSRQQEPGFPINQHEIKCALIKGNLNKGLKTTIFNTKEVTSFAVQDLFLAILHHNELHLWDHTRNVKLWTQPVNLCREYLCWSSIRFVGKALVYSESKESGDLAQVFNLDGTKTAHFYLHSAPYFFSYDKILNLKEDQKIGCIDLHGNVVSEWAINDRCSGFPLLFEQEEFGCALSGNILSITNKITHEIKTIQLDDETATYTYRPLFGTCYAFYKILINQATPSPVLIIDLREAQIINSNAFAESGPITTLLHHKGWIYVADKIGSLVAYHLNGTSVTLIDNKENTVCDFTTTLSIDDDFLVSHSEQMYKSATISIWSTITKKLLGSFVSAKGRARLINGKIFSNTTKGLEVFDLLRKTLIIPH